jgi:hypothetical protein
MKKFNNALKTPMMPMGGPRQDRWKKFFMQKTINSAGISAPENIRKKPFGQYLYAIQVLHEQTKGK